MLSIANAYVCYRYVVFRSHGERAGARCPRFSSVYLVALAANLIVLPLALRTLPFNAYVVQALFTMARGRRSATSATGTSASAAGRGTGSGGETSTPDDRDPGGA